MKLRGAAAGLALFAALPLHADPLDWEPVENPKPSAPVRVARNVRDGFLTFGDAFIDLNTAAFGAFSLLASQITMAASDLVGVVDDNPVTQHVTKGIVSKSLAKTAYLWHLAGAESVLGGHGQDKERWATESAAQLNPLLSEEDAEELAPIPLEPESFVREGMVHTDVYRPHAPFLDLGAALVDDVVMRPVAGLLRIVQLRDAGDAVEDRGNAMVRSAVRAGW
jgi:hypothetical protein